MIERRVIEAAHAELRVAKREGGLPTIRGYAARFNSTSKRMRTPQGREFVERIAPGAFSDALSGGDDTKATVQHDPDVILGRRSKNTLKLSEDENGLLAEITPPDTQLGRDTVTQVDRGDLDKMSFAFRAAEDSWERGQDGCYLRTLRKIKGLADVTLTDRPAYEETSVSLRMADEAIDRLEMRGSGQEPPKPLPDDRELRATRTVYDSSMVDACRSAVAYLRCAFDACNNIIDSCEQIDGDISDRDQRAMDDAYGELVDLIAKARDCKKALEMLGAEDEDRPAGDAGDATEEASYQETAAKAHRTKLEAGSLTPEEARKILAEHSRAIDVNKPGVSHVEQLIKAGKVDHGDWDESKVNRSKSNSGAFLGVDTDHKPSNAARWKFPVVAGGKVNRKALGSAAAYAKQNGYSAIAAAAERLGEMCDEKKDDDKSA
jgi:HK97 family phage prohead protease